VTFALPHPEARRGGRGGGGAARGGEADEAAIRAFAGERLAAFKVPRKVVILDEIPKGRDRQAAAHRAGGEAGAGGRRLREGFRRCCGDPCEGASAPSRSPERYFRKDEGDRRACGDGRDMKICIFGAGAIGGYMGVKLAQAGADVSLVARGPHLAAMRGKGLTLIEEGGTVTVPVTASEDPAELGVQDYVIVTLKAHSVPPVVADAAADRAGDDGRLGRERGALVVFPQDRRAAGGNAAGKRRSGQRAMGRVRPRPGAGLRGLSGGGGVGAGD
jgi:hypothetical protein